MVLDRIAVEFRLAWCRDRDGILITSWDDADRRTKPFTDVYPLPAGMVQGAIVTDDAVELSRLIATTLEPDEWDEVGGMGVVRPAGGAFVLHHLPHFHRRVRALLANLQSPPADSRQAFSPDYWPAGEEMRIFAALREKDSIDFEDTPLDQALAILGARHGIKIVLAQTTLAEAAIALDTPVTKKLRNLSLQTILREVLADLQLTYVVRDDVLQITTREDAHSEFVHRLYDVDELVGRNGKGEFSDVISMITTTIEPDSWDEVGGPGTIAALGQRWLVVSQAQENHEQIEPLLTQLRQILKAAGPLEVLICPPQSTSAEVNQALDREVTLSFRDKPLDELCDWLTDLLHVPVLLSRSHLEDAAVYEDTPITVDLPPLPLRHALEITLRDMQLAPKIDGEVLRITTAEDAESKLDIRIFDVRHLTAPGAEGIDERSLDHLIRSGIRPDSWDEVGGPGALSYFRGQLVVWQTNDVQQEVRHLIDVLSEHLLSPPTDKPAQSVWLGRSTAEEEILARLGERESLHVVDPNVEELVRTLCTRHSIPVLFRQSYRDNTDDAPLSDFALDFHDAPLHEILTRLLQEKGGGFVTWNGVLFVTDEETAESQLRAKMYPVGPHWPTKEKHRGQEVTKLLAEHIEPDSWEGVGGPGYAMPVNGEWLLVVQTLDVHRQIDEAIARLRAGQPLPAPK
jgi:hypothetical protein